MKKILLAAVAALAIVGCSQNEEIEKAGEKAEINFGTVVKAGTKAAITETDNFATFTVRAYKTEDKMVAAPALSSVFMNDLLVERTLPNTEWIHTGTFYWPLSGYVQFFATSPKQALKVTTGYPTFDYTIATADKQVDLVAANVIDAEKTENAVDLAFQHLLTQINFSIKGDTEDFTYTVTKLELKGAKDKSTFTFDGSNTIGSWGTPTVSAANVSYIYDEASVTVAPVKDLDLKSDFETTDNALFMLMPQTLTDVTLEITYSAAPTSDLTAKTFDGVKTVNLTGAWEMGKSIRYTLKLTSDAADITFNPSVSGWGDETPGTNTNPVTKP